MGYVSYLYKVNHINLKKQVLGRVFQETLSMIYRICFSRRVINSWAWERSRAHLRAIAIGAGKTNQITLFQ